MKLAIYQPEKAMLALKDCNTPAKCLQSTTPTLAEIRKEHGENKTLTAVEAWIVDTSDFMNVSRPMNPKQIRQTAILVLSDFYYFKVADINLVFTRAKKGQFGELYGSLDGTKIYSWFDKYDCERSGEAYNEALRKHDNIKASE